jgi:heat shock protein HslJ
VRLHGRWAALTAVTVAILALSACSPFLARVGNSGPQPGALVGTWALDTTFATSEQPFIAFRPDNTWIASDGCNRIRGTWDLQRNGRLVTTSGPHTLQWCDGAQLPVAVSQADRVRVRGDSLILISSADSTETHLIRSNDPLVGPNSSPIGYWVERNAPTAPFLSITADRSFTGNDGCNSIFGTWTIADDETTQFSDVGSTRMACEGVDTWLSQLATGHIVAGVMTISSSDGTVIGQLFRR